MNKSVQLVEGGGTFHLEDISTIDGGPLYGYELPASSRFRDGHDMTAASLV